MTRLPLPRPFVKWAGGKAQLTDELLVRTPESFRNYYEPFVGGGALFFSLYRADRIRRAWLSDLNSELVDTYIAIRDDVEALIGLLSTYRHDRDFFYKIRNYKPEELSLVERAARLLYLNKTCYNGLYRVNKQGQFNVPFGSYKSPKICDEPNLLAVSQALQGVKIACKSFETVARKASKQDLVYFDPPYEPLSKTANFTSYQKDGFTQDSQRLLRDVCHKLTKREAKVILSNSSAALIHELYGSNGFHIDEVQANRAINSNPAKRGKLTELIVTNYKPASA